MTEQPRSTDDRISETEATELMRSLLHKEGNWVNWGQKCQKLQKAGYDSQLIFEQTGFQNAQQNLIIVAAQVFESLIKSGADEDLLSYYIGPRSDVLYELRILNQEQRLGAAKLAAEKRIEVAEAHDIAKAIQDFSRLSQIPSEFTRHPGDAIAYQCWKRGKQKRDLAERAKLIAKGLKFAHSDSARQAIESLLQDFTVTP
ncbi:RuBisCO accumulation factor 1, partial [Microcystis sp.]